jgi:hypothetical protein
MQQGTKTMKKIIIAISILFSITTLNAEEKKNVVYKYKDYESIDLGSFDIKGEVIAPGDLTVNDRERKVFKRELLEKQNFDYENKREIENLR